MDNQPQDIAQDAEINSNKKRINPKIFIYAIAIIVVIIAIIFVARSFIAATVDGSIITKSSVTKTLEKKMGKQVVDSFIVEKLIENAAKENKIEISTEDLDNEIKKIESEVSAQGSTLEAVLGQQGITLEDLKKQIVIQKELEKILGDQVQVSPAEIDKYITDNKITVPKGQEDLIKGQVSSVIYQQKFAAKAQEWIDGAKKEAKIKYYAEY